MELVLLKVLIPTATSFLIGILLTPFITRQLYQRKLWKKRAGKDIGYGGGGTPIFNKLHQTSDTNTPRMGGIVIWLSVCITVLIFTVLGTVWPETILSKLDYLSRSQTWLPLGALLIGALVGFIDDLLTIRGDGKHFAGGLPLSQRLLAVIATSLFIGWWFYEKLDITTVQLFGFTELSLGIWFIPFFVFVSVCIYMSSVIDGIDGLAGGVFLFIFTAYSFIALWQAQIDIAAFCATIVGGLLAFLWFNIPPARFYMSETGIMALTMTLTVIAFMTDSLGEGVGVSVLPIIAFLLVVTVITNTIQIISKKFFGRKVFLIAPLHHHFEAIGWPQYKVTMRYWVLGFVCAVLGIIVAIAGN